MIVVPLVTVHDENTFLELLYLSQPLIHRRTMLLLLAFNLEKLNAAIEQKSSLVINLILHLCCCCHVSQPSCTPCS